MWGVVTAGEEAVEVDVDRTRSGWIFEGGNLARAERWWFEVLEKGRLGADWMPGRAELDGWTMQHGPKGEWVAFRLASVERRWMVGLESMAESGDDETLFGFRSSLRMSREIMSYHKAEILMFDGGSTKPFWIVIYSHLTSFPRCRATSRQLQVVDSKLVCPLGTIPSLFTRELVTRLGVSRCRCR